MLNITLKKAIEDVAELFDKMEIANETIKKYKALYPEFSKAIDNSFMILYPDGILSECSGVIFSRHCEELLLRVANGQDTRPATNAEALLLFQHISLRTKAQLEFVMAYEKLFSETFPESPLLDSFVEMKIGNRYGPQIEQTIEEVKRKLYRKNRVINGGYKNA